MITCAYYSLESVAVMKMFAACSNLAALCLHNLARVVCVTGEVLNSGTASVLESSVLQVKYSAAALLQYLSHLCYR